jgi:formamidopyrimidine-DNA glycosylase
MPELPEVEAMSKGLREAGVPGSWITAVSLPRTRVKPLRVCPSLEQARRKLVQRQIVRVWRWGKAVVVDLHDGQHLVVEPRMTGLFLVQCPGDPRYIRLRLELEGGRASSVYFWDRRGLGQIHLWSSQEFEQRRAAGVRGPDALEVDLPVLRQALATSRRVIKVALLEQRFLSGIGNLYASEILHRARIHPQQRCCDLRPIHWRRLHEAIHAVLREAIDSQGSTLADATYLTVNGEPGRFQYRHRVYQKTGQPCSTCGRATIRRIVLAQRSTFYCPRCQRLRGS